ncbi:protoporphyrinogen oxidase [Danaus plexippus]|uniref:Protoporphyrinogen oxidase n=1 Tax=Danaus plexippus plexippus TaxID=278856 RepID=A0A212EUU5_DANPL|nr:protoporphyrinogen oxidase [Danaus plexippus]OWR45256.1 protoporphyrinogen oxidase [Danaus plexippus plexippus]
MAAILGGGLGGLSTGYYLLKNNISNNNNLKIFLLEATDYCGGWIKSIRTKDYIFEQGPRTIRPRGPTGLNTLNMLQDLGLSEHISAIKPDHPAAKNRMIYVNNSLHLLPSSIKGVFQKTEPFSKPLIYAALNDLKNPHKELKDDSIYNFVERRFGKEIADYAVSPMICGICAGDAKEISVKFLMKTLFEYEQNDGGVIKGLMKGLFKTKNETEIQLSDLARRAQEEKWNVYSIKGGLQTIPNKMSQYLQDNDVNLHLNSQIDELEFVDSSLVKLKKGNETLTATHVYSSIPSHVLAKLVTKQHPELAKILNDIPFVTVGIVNLYFATRKPLIKPAFGFLVPPIENSPILGVVFDSCCIPDQNGTVLTVMLGGRWFKEKFGPNITKEQLFDIATKEIKSILKIDEQVTAHNVSILDKCIPQYVIGHYERVDEIRQYIVNNNLPISLIGSSYDGVGINDVIYSAKTQVGEDIIK